MVSLPEDFRTEINPPVVSLPEDRNPAVGTALSLPEDLNLPVVSLPEDLFLCGNPPVVTRS